MNNTTVSEAEAKVVLEILECRCDFRIAVQVQIRLHKIINTGANVGSSGVGHSVLLGVHSQVGHGSFRPRSQGKLCSLTCPFDLE
jgi:hypothetical protein